MGRSLLLAREASAAFYGALFGWEHVPPENPEQSDGYGMFTLRGKLVAGVGPLMSEDQPIVWSTIRRGR